MPCYQRNEFRAELGTARKEIITAAARALGYSVAEGRNSLTINTPRGAIQVRGDVVSTSDTEVMREAVNELKIGVQKEALKLVAAKNNWQLQFTAGNKFELSRTVG